jgi:ssDNA-binding replication factor A large subunit
MPRAFEKNNRKGEYVSMVLGDNTGEIRATFWGMAAKKIGEEKIQRGDFLEIQHAYVSLYREKPRLQVGRESRIKKISEQPGFPVVSAPLVLSEIQPNMQGVDVVGRVKRVFEEQTFEREGEKRRVVRFVLYDGQTEKPCVAWNEAVIAVRALRAGDLVKIEGAYTKEGRKDIELHLGWHGRILKNPSNTQEIPETKMKRKKISECVEEGETEILATVMGVARKRLGFFVCRQCKKTVREQEESLVCENCGTTEAFSRLVLTLELDDGTGRMPCTFFGREAEIIAGITGKEWLAQRKNEEELWKKVENTALGKELVVRGVLQKDLSGNLEMRGYSAKEMEPKKELARLLEA